MATPLSAEDIHAIAHRVVELMGERLSTPQVAVPALPVIPRRESQTEKQKLQDPARLAYTLKQLCAELGLSPITIYRLDARGLIKSVPGIRRKIYSRAEVERFLAGNQGNWRLDRL